MSRRIHLAGFDATFAAHPDPWRTHTARDEASKRQAILRALGRGRTGRVLELGCGNGSNSVRLARRALYLSACDGTVTATRLTRAALAEAPGARVCTCVLPNQFPRGRFEAIVIAELLYYMLRWQMQQLARRVARALVPGGRVVLAHHHIDFHDTAQTARAIHGRWLAATQQAWTRRYTQRNHRWMVDGMTLDRTSSAGIPAIDCTPATTSTLCS